MASSSSSMHIHGDDTINVQFHKHQGDPLGGWINFDAVESSFSIHIRTVPQLRNVFDQLNHVTEAIAALIETANNAE